MTQEPRFTVAEFIQALTILTRAHAQTLHELAPIEIEPAALQRVLDRWIEVELKRYPAQDTLRQVLQEVRRLHTGFQNQI